MGRARAIERRTVSRKTPGDGKLEITKSAAHRLETLGADFPLVVDGKRGDGALGTLPCTCRGHDKPHVHYFVVSDLFRSLAAGGEVDLFLDEDARRLLVVTA
jgi:hypothetical protein